MVVTPDLAIGRRGLGDGSPVGGWSRQGVASPYDGVMSRVDDLSLAIMGEALLRGRTFTSSFVVCWRGLVWAA